MVKDKLLNSSLESLPHPMYVIDPRSYKIKRVNSAAMLPHLAKDCRCYTLFHGRSEPCSNSGYLCPLQEMKKTKKPVRIEHIHFDENGNARNVEIYAYPVLDSNGCIVDAIEHCQDITVCKQEKILLENLLKISRLINIAGNTDELYKSVSDSVQELIGFDTFMIFQVLNGAASLAYYSGDKNSKRENLHRQCEELINYCIESKQCFIPGNDRNGKFAGAKGVKSQIVVPFIIEGECTGALYISRAVQDAYRQHDLDMVKSLCDVLSPALKNPSVCRRSSLENNKGIERSRIEILINTAQKLQTRNSWKEGLTTILEGVSTLGFEKSGIFLVNLRKGTMDFHFGEGIELSDLDSSISLKDSEHSGVRSVLKKELCVEPSVLKKGIGFMSGSHFVWAPIIVDDAVFAVLAGGSKENDRITDEKLRDLEFLAGMCGSFIERTRVEANPVPEKNLKTDFKYWLDSSECYVVTEVKPRKSFDIFMELVTHGIPGFVISREHPQKIKKKYRLLRTPVLWLSRSGMENSINPEDFLKLDYTLRKFTRASEDSVILLDGLEYLMIQTSFATATRYLQELKDMVITNNSRLIIPLHKETLSGREFSILEKEFTIIPPW
ncbi:MAG: DUF835 domain-containing protein [Theionarchaea archaeon]|nr:DUF835 domain-containing protein [Theionarchaea archaeon]